MVMELLCDYEENLDEVVMNPERFSRYGYDKGAEYKGELSSYGYHMIEYGWFFMDGISFSVEICLDHQCTCPQHIPGRCCHRIKDANSQLGEQFLGMGRHPSTTGADIIG